MKGYVTTACTIMCFTSYGLSLHLNSPLPTTACIIMCVSVLNSPPTHHSLHNHVFVFSKLNRDNTLRGAYLTTSCIIICSTNVVSAKTPQQSPTHHSLHNYLFHFCDNTSTVPYPSLHNYMCFTQHLNRPVLSQPA